MLGNIGRWLVRKLFGPKEPTFAPKAGPARLLVMRHAEKTGKRSDHHLSKAGAERAQRLVTYIPQTFGRPDFLIAASRSKYSNRPYETVEPLAKALGLDIVDSIEDEDFAGLVEELSAPRHAGKLGVISWRHSDLPGLLTELGAPDGTYPRSWDTDLYNLVIELDYRSGPVPAVRQHVQPF